MVNVFLWETGNTHTRCMGLWCERGWIEEVAIKHNFFSFLSRDIHADRESGVCGKEGNKDDTKKEIVVATNLDGCDVFFSLVMVKTFLGWRRNYVDSASSASYCVSLGVVKMHLRAG